MLETSDIFTPCAAPGSLLEAMTEAAKRTDFGTAPLFSPACSSFDPFRNCQQSGEMRGRELKSMGRGAVGGGPYIHGKYARDLNADPVKPGRTAFDSEFLEEKPRTTRINHSSMKGRDSRQENE